MTFTKEPERTNFAKVQTPLFFGMIDSHITMKISKNGEAFFFVNDFKGNALAGQKIRVYSNEFKEKDTQYSYENGKYSEKATYFSPLDTNVFISGAILGETDVNGILKIQLKDKVAAHFQKTLDSWDYGSDGKWDSFFVTASSDTNLSYVSSKWNGGITPWNF